MVAAMLLVATGALRRPDGFLSAAYWSCGNCVGPVAAVAGDAGRIGHRCKRRLVANRAIGGEEAVRIRQFAGLPERCDRSGGARKGRDPSLERRQAEKVAKNRPGEEHNDNEQKSQPGDATLAKCAALQPQSALRS